MGDDRARRARTRRRDRRWRRRRTARSSSFLARPTSATPRCASRSARTASARPARAQHASSPGVRKVSPAGRIASCASWAFLTFLAQSPRLLADVVGAVELGHLGPRRRNRRGRQRRRVGTHVGDVAVLVQALGDPHRRLRRHPQLAAGFLLQRRRDEGRGRRAAVGLLLHRAHRERDASQCARTSELRGRLVENDNAVWLLQLGTVVEVAASRDAATVDTDQVAVKRDGSKVPAMSQ